MTTKFEVSQVLGFEVLRYLKYFEKRLRYLGFEKIILNLTLSHVSVLTNAGNAHQSRSSMGKEEQRHILKANNDYGAFFEGSKMVGVHANIG